MIEIDELIKIRDAVSSLVIQEAAFISRNSSECQSEVEHKRWIDCAVRLKDGGGKIQNSINSLITLSGMTIDQKFAAARFNETTEDGQEYDVSKAMMKELCEIGLVVHKGAGYYEQTDLMLESAAALRAVARNGA